MRSAELERLVQEVTDQVLTELNSTKKVAEFNDKRDSYPAWFRNAMSTDFNCQFNKKQDSNAILLCLSKLNLTDLLAISKLIAVNSRCQKVLDYILKGYPVWVVGKEEEFLKNKKEQRFAVQRNVYVSLNTVKKYNISFISDIGELKKDIVLFKKQNNINIQKKFITLHEVQKRAKKGETLIKHYEVPTDLAREWIKERVD